MEIKELKNLLLEFGENVRFEHDLRKKNWFNIGGKSKVFYKAENLKELVNFIKKIKGKEKIFILGAGSNTLITDNLFDGIVVKLGKNFNNISLLDDNVIIAGSAVSDKALSSFAIDNNLSGFEFLSGIPGTIGGGIRMNAGCFGKEFKDILLSIQAIDAFGNVITMPAEEIKFEYLAEVILENGYNVLTISDSPLMEHDAMYMKLITERVQSRRMERIARREAADKIKESRKAAAETK